MSEPAKPRMMRANPKSIHFSRHAVVHEEDDYCPKGHACTPVVESPQMGNCSTPHKLTNLPSKFAPWTQQPHAETDSCSHWAPVVESAAPQPSIEQLCLEIRNLAHRGWEDRPNAEFLFREINKKAQIVASLAASPHPLSSAAPSNQNKDLGYANGCPICGVPCRGHALAAPQPSPEPPQQCSTKDCKGIPKYCPTCALNAPSPEPAATPLQWNLVEEVLPGDRQRVLTCTSPTSDVIVCMFKRGKFITQPGMWDSHPVYWQNLPAPPTTRQTARKTSESSNRTDALERLLVAAVRLAIVRSSLKGEDDVDISDEEAEHIGQDTAWACQGEGTCDEHPIPEWTEVWQASFNSALREQLERAIRENEFWWEGLPRMCLTKPICDQIDHIIDEQFGGEK